MININDGAFIRPTHPNPNPSNTEEHTRLAAKQKIQRLMLRFQETPEKLKQLCQDLDCMESQILNPTIEKLLAKYLRQQWPVMDSSLKPLKTKDPLHELKTNTRSKISMFFNLVKNTSAQKTFVITNETEGLNERKAPQVKIFSKNDCTSTTPLYFVALPNEKIQQKIASLQPVKNQEDADFLVKSLAKIEELAWPHKKDGCYTRAILACQLLESMSIPRSHIKKIEAIGSLSWNTTKDRVPLKNRQWVAHIAPIVTSESGTRYIIDPSINPDRALSIEEWKGLLGPVKELEESAPTNTFDCIGKSPSDRALKLEKASKAGFTQIYNYRQISSVPFCSQTRALLEHLL